MTSSSRFWSGLVACLLMLQPAAAAEVVGKVIAAKAEVYGGSQSAKSVLKAGDPIHFLDQLSTNATGLGEFMLDDGTKLALSPSASLVIDQFVRKERSTFAKLGAKATKGTFRWISGQSSSSAYQINTPTGTMGIRGTAFDVANVGGITHIALLNGEARFCMQDDCQTLGKMGDYIRSDGKSLSKPVDIRTVFTSKAQAAQIFPFLANPALLSPMFQVPGSNILSNLSLNEPGVGNSPQGSPPNPGGGGGGSGLAGMPAGVVAGGAAAGSLIAAGIVLMNMDDEDEDETPVTPE